MRQHGDVDLDVDPAGGGANGQRPAFDADMPQYPGAWSRRIRVSACLPCNCSFGRAQNRRRLQGVAGSPAIGDDVIPAGLHMFAPAPGLRAESVPQRILIRPVRKRPARQPGRLCPFRHVGYRAALTPRAAAPAFRVRPGS